MMPSTTSASDRDLTTWFINAKRSLSCVSLCTRANELVNLTRAALQRATVLSSRCIFLRQALQDQLGVIKQTKVMLDSIRTTARKDFENSLRELDSANAKLNDILTHLSQTSVELAFRPTEDEFSRTLHDFVDDEGVENLRTQLRSAIDQIQASETDFATSIGTFNDYLGSLQDAITTLPSPTSSGTLAPVHDLSPSLEKLEEQAAAMASLLESLARHYDQCSLALKQSETSHNSRALNSTVIRSDGNNNNSTSEPPVTDQERAEMLQVLERDAVEVDDVVSEIKDRLGEMEHEGSSTMSATADLEAHYADTLTAFSIASDFERELVVIISKVKDYQMQQSDMQLAISGRLDEMLRLAEHYTLFSEAYDALIIEVGRRVGMQRRKETILNEALAKIEQLNEQDSGHREIFRSDYGEYLPFDIWPGLSNPPTAYTLEPVQMTELPDLETNVIESALTRRAKGNR